MLKICILVPCFNEEGNLEDLNRKLQKVVKLNKTNDYEFEILFVDDGSSDNTLEQIKKLYAKYENVRYISLSRNFGHQNALKAGIDNVNADAVITMDADLQHPPELIHKMIEFWENGYDVVNTKRQDSENQSWFKRKASSLFYRLLNFLSYIRIEPGTADFRLMDKKIIDELKRWNEQNLFFRGIIPWLGFKQYTFSYYPDKRHAGETKYTLKKMFGFALDGVTSFSIKPLRISILIWFLLSLLSVIYMFYALYISIFTDQAIQGWASVIVSTLFIGGLQLLILGIIGEYLGKLYIENKRRPGYIIGEMNMQNEKGKRT
jgi:dolichol-phosphate mannosyltransferase